MKKNILYCITCLATLAQQVDVHNLSGSSCGTFGLLDRDLMTGLLVAVLCLQRGHHARRDGFQQGRLSRQSGIFIQLIRLEFGLCSCAPLKRNNSAPYYTHRSEWRRSVQNAARARLLRTIVTALRIELGLHNGISQHVGRFVGHGQQLWQLVGADRLVTVRLVVLLHFEARFSHGLMVTSKER
jgi:hypothetical protein